NRDQLTEECHACNPSGSRHRRSGTLICVSSYTKAGRRLDNVAVRAVEPDQGRDKTDASEEITTGSSVGRIVRKSSKTPFCSTRATTGRGSRRRSRAIWSADRGGPDPSSVVPTRSPQDARVSPGREPPPTADRSSTAS